MITSKNICEIFFAISSFIGLLSATIPPKELVGSVLKALSHASEIFFCSETPQGLACLIIATAGLENSFTNSKAASESLKLLYDKSFPWSCS